LRAEIRALAINRRSIVAIKRPNRLFEGAKPMEAVLDIEVPFTECDERHVVMLGTIYVYQMPAAMRLFAWQHFLFCSATN
jgi:hypothetical protein